MADVLHEWLFVVAAVALGAVAVEWWRIARGWWTALLLALAVEQLGLGLLQRAVHVGAAGAPAVDWLGWMGAVLAFVAVRVALGRLVWRAQRTGVEPGREAAGEDGDGDGQTAVGTPAGRTG